MINPVDGVVEGGENIALRIGGKAEAVLDQPAAPLQAAAEGIGIGANGDKPER